jgi:hypothetical protein
MSKVVEMLEGDIESLEMPPDPTMYPDEVISADETTNLDQTISSGFISSSDSIENITKPLMKNIYWHCRSDSRDFILFFYFRCWKLVIESMTLFDFRCISLYLNIFCKIYTILMESLVSIFNV